MENRREFLKTVAISAIVARSVLGANEKVRMAVIGTGTRGRMVNGFFRKQPDCEFVAACDVRKSRLDEAMKEIGGSVQGYGDYRKILERKDIDAVLVTTPDHWHGPIVAQACEAGKDAYVEKPMTHTIEDAVIMVEAAKKYKKIVQLGVQQRSGAHFQEACKLVQDGCIGKVTHCVLIQPGGYTQNMQPTETPPPDLDWEMFQGPAPRRPYSPSYLRWRSFYMYGGGLITDWGVHLTDIAMLAMQADGKAPIHSSASAQYVHFPRDPEQLPDAFSCVWQYDNFLMTFTNAVLPPSQDGFPQNGNYFYGSKGVLHVNRSGYRVMPQPQRGGTGRESKESPPPPIEAKSYKQDEQYQNDPHTIAHARNFLDCVKSRKSPTADITTVGFSSTISCLLGRLAVKEGKSFAWDGQKAIPV